MQGQGGTETSAEVEGDVREFKGYDARSSTVMRVDNLAKFLDSGKITSEQHDAGAAFREIVDHFYRTTTGLGRLDEHAGAVGGDGDPIRLYFKARAARVVNGRTVGYVSTQRPPSRGGKAGKRGFDGWTTAKLESLNRFRRVCRIVQFLPPEPHRALCQLVIDPVHPHVPALNLAQCSRRRHGSQCSRLDRKQIAWLCEALDALYGVFGEVALEEAA